MPPAREKRIAVGWEMVYEDSRSTLDRGLSLVIPEPHTKRQATQHDGLPGLLGDGDTGI
jgi:hypothetical protein